MASTYLTKSISSTGTNTKGTYSGWIKRGDLTNNYPRFFAINTDANRYLRLFFHNDDKLHLYIDNSSGIGQRKTTRVFRDTSAYYHIVVAIDSTLGTASDRIKVWVNGVQETTFDSTINPSQNADMMINNSGTTFVIGKHESASTDYFNGVMSHVHWIDGTAYDASAFGSTDTTTGEWKINTSPSVTYGTNGFFILKDGNSVTDQSGNSNNFTVAGGTLTKTEDCPSNVFATLNPLAGSASDYTLSNGNTSFQNTGGWSWKPSTICPSKGKFYYEVKMTGSTPLYEVVGVVPFASWDKIDNETIGAGSGGEAESVGYNMSGNVIKGNSTVYSGTSYTVGDVVCVAVDLDNRAIYFRKNGGSWENSGDPTSGASKTGAASLSTTLDDWSLSTSGSGSDAGSSINYGNGYFGTTQISSEGTNASGIGKFEYDVPTGYTALSTKGLNE